MFGRPEAVVCDANQVLPATGFIGHVQPSGSGGTCGNTGLITGAPCIVAGNLDPAGVRSAIQQSCSNETNNITITVNTNPAVDFGGLHLSADGSCDYRATWTSNGVTYSITGTATRIGVNIVLTNLRANGGVFDAADDLDSAAANLTPLIMNNTARSMNSGVHATVSQRYR